MLSFFLFVLLSTLSESTTTVTLFDATIHCKDYNYNHIEQQYRCICATETNEALLNYASFHYCTMNESSFSLFLLTVWLLFLFYIIAGTADDYLVPALTIGVDILEIPHTLAGSTILAFANGAPDLFTGIAAFSGDSPDGELGLGSLLGGGMFLTSFTLGMIVLIGGPLDTNRRPLLRDVVMYTSGLAFLLAIYADNQVSVFESAMFMAMYASYVIILIGGRLIYQRYMKPKQMALLDKEKVGVELGDQPYGIQVTQLAPSSLCISPTNGETVGYKCTPVKRISMGGEHSQKELLAKMSLTEYEEKMRMSWSRSLRSSSSHRSEAYQSNNSLSSSTNCIYQLVHNVKQFIDWDSLSVFGKILCVPELPFTLARRLTIAWVEPETWNYHFSILTLVFAPQFIMWVITKPSLGVAVMIGCGSVLFGALAYSKLPSLYPKTKVVLLFFVTLAFIVSTVWAYLIANEIVEVMKTIGLGLGISSGVLGVTVLAWGNSVGDFISNLALAKSGHSKMAAAECFGGPIFNLLFGGGISFMLGSLNASPLSMAIPEDGVASYGFTFLFISLLSTGVVVPLTGFQFQRWFAVYLVLLYIVFVILVILNQAGIIPQLF